MGAPASFYNVLAGLETTQALLLGAGTTFNGRPLSGGGANVVTVSAGATTLAITPALHAGKTVVLQNTAPIAVTLPAATGTGDKYEFFVDAAATATSSTISAASATDYMSGVCWAATTATNAVLAYIASATSAIIQLNGTTKGGVVGDKIVLIDVGASLWSAQLFTAPTGSTVTPFVHG